MGSAGKVICGQRAAWLLGTAALVLVFPNSAFAQSAEPQAAEQQADAADSGNEILVTANRREERSQDVPTVITSYSAEKLSQLDITEPQDLYGTAPSLVVGNQGQATRDVQSFSIRGQSTGFLASPAVAQYFGEVPLVAGVTLSLQGGPGLFLDLANVQVLSGPQGTLFGRNTTGGAVLFTPHKPTNEFEGYIEGTYGSHELVGFEGAINVPVVDDKVLVRVAGTYRDRDGFTKDLLFNKNRDDVHYYSGRISLLLRPFEGFENTTVAFGSKSRNNGTGFIHEGFNIPGLKGVGFCGDTAATIIPGLGVNCNVYRSQTAIAQRIGPRQTRSSVDAFSAIKAYGVINTTTLELSDNLTLRNIISYQRLKDNYAGDQDGTPLQQYENNANAPNTKATNIEGLAPGIPPFGYINAKTGFKGVRDDLKQFTEELQLQGKGLDGKMDYAAGYFHYSATPSSVWGSTGINYCPALFTGACPYSDTLTGVSNKSDAVYAQGTVDLGAISPSLDRLRLTAGYRHTWDTVSGFTTVYDATLKSKASTWTIGLDYKPIDNLLVYGKVSRGFKAGGFNTFAVRVETRTFEPEQLTSYEAGFKSDMRLGDVPLKLNATYYYSDYSNIQRPAGDFNPTPPPGVASNGARILAAQARIQGIELEASIRPTNGLEIGGNFSYTDAKYKKFDVPIFAPGTVTCNGVKGFGDTGDFSCNRFQFVSPYIYNIFASLDLPLSDNLGSLSFYTNYSHVSAQGTAPLGNAITEPGSVLAGYGLLNASVTWKDVAGSGIDLTAFGTNLTDKLFRTSNSNVFNSLLVRTSIYGEPRMYGVKARFTF